MHDPKRGSVRSNRLPAAVEHGNGSHEQSPTTASLFDYDHANVDQ